MVKVTSKGQVTLPVEIRRQLNIEPGDRVEVEIVEEEEARLKISKPPSLEDLYGVLETDKSYPGKKEVREAVGKKKGKELAGDESE